MLNLVTASNRSLDLRSIRPHGGNQRDAFEELSFLLFARERRANGIPSRRQGAGGDGGLEGIIADTEGRALCGIQAKFFADKMGSSQWRNLDDSISTALSDNARDSTLREIVVTLPCTLTQTQTAKWKKYCLQWSETVTRLGYPHGLVFTLWNESDFRDLLLKETNRGLLLHFFEYPDFDSALCHKKTRIAVEGLGDRYQPELHTTTGAEAQLHTFLRSERSRQEYLKKAREILHDRSWWLRAPRSDWSQQLRAVYDHAESAWQLVLAQLGDGVSLPTSFSAIERDCWAAAEAIDPLEDGIAALIPPREPQPSDNYGFPRSKHPNEEILNSVERWRHALRSFASYFRENALADSSCLLFTGAPGMGKTHVLAEVCSRFSMQGGIVLFIEGLTFTSSDPIWLQFVRWAGFTGKCLRDFLETIAAMAEPTKLPALLCIDAVNETPDRNLWRIGLESFAAEVRSVAGVKLIVSCRNDYLIQTLPTALAKKNEKGWAFAEHEGLGIEVFEAFPKYIAAYGVHWNGLPPLAHEFQNPLFLKTFCEAYAGQKPEPGSLSLATVLHKFAERKAILLGSRIDCDPSRVLLALRDLANSMMRAHALHISESTAQEICEQHHAPTESSRSLYRALISEGVLDEFLGPRDDLGATYLVRFTYERVWDYFVSLRVLPLNSSPTPALLKQLRNPEWRLQNAGVVGMLLTRCAEEGHGELVDLISPDSAADSDLLELLLDSLPWRTRRSVSLRTWELFMDAICSHGLKENDLDYLVLFSSNPEHPWNADWLHERLARMPLAERDRYWTFWVNEQFLNLSANSPIRELLAWAECAPLNVLADAHRLLLATVLAWCASATVPEARQRLAATLTRLLAGRTHLATQLVARFLPIDDPYVRERVLLAAAGAAQHANSGDPDLSRLAQTVHSGIFGGRTVEPHLFIRHYATEVCQQAQSKGMLPENIAPESFHPPFRSRWPTIWTEARYLRERKALNARPKLFASVEPGPEPGYGNWGRYIMAGRVHDFQSRRLHETPAADRSSCFDARIAKRYVVQRVFAFGWDAASKDIHPDNDYYAGNRRPVERLSKKYQWIALYELLGLLADHFHFRDFNGRVQPFRSAHQLGISDLLDPFVVEAPPARINAIWDFVPIAAPWWRGRLDPLPYPLPATRQRKIAEERESFNPKQLIELFDGKREWLTLSAFHLWKEPVPVWHGEHEASHVCIEWAIQSYLVSPDRVGNLIAHLNEEGFSNNSRRWLEEPEFGQSLAALRAFPEGQEKLRRRCQLDKTWETEGWITGAFSTTCRCAPDEEKRRVRDGSMPSPQLADLGNLRWMGRAFDFGTSGQTETIVCHVGKGFEGACIAHREPLQKWLSQKKLQIVWRAYGFKYRHHEQHGENHARTHWTTFTQQEDGSLICCGGATHAFPHGPGPLEPLPWD